MTAARFAPALLVLLVSNARHGARSPELPFYRSGAAAPEWIRSESAAYASIHRVGPFSLRDQNNIEFNARNLAAHVSVVSFFFTECRDLCPRLRSNLSPVQQSFEGDTVVQILSHSITERDDAAALQRYARVNHIDGRRWHLLRGPTAEIARLARNDYFSALPDSVNGQPVKLLHSETVTLVDRHGRVRGLYDGSLPFDVDRLIDDIRVLLASDD